MHRSQTTRARWRASAVAAWVALFALLLAIGGTRAAHPASATAVHGMVVAESELGARAGLEVLQAGGNAVDAAAAAALATCVTNAASCGIGGGGFMLIYSAKTGLIHALDYRERAPARASPAMFMRNGKPDPELAQSGVLAVAVPGEIAGIDAALKRFGTMRFQQVAGPAIRIAREGFPASPLLAREIEMLAPKLAQDPYLRETFLKPDGSAPQPGEILHQKRLADTLARLGDDAARNFYHGPIAQELVTHLGQRGGIVSADDLASYEVIWRDPIHRPYGDFIAYTMPPPSSGGVVLSMLGMLEPNLVAGLGAGSPPYLVRVIEVMRQGFIDRSLYADPAYVDVPLKRLLSDAHIAEARRRAFSREPPPAMGAGAHDAGTTNLCVVDKERNVAVVTTTINTMFGAKFSVPSLGIILNNEMDDFSIGAGVPNAYQLAGTDANAIAPGKRPLSSMSPMIVLRDGKPVFALGGSGGPTIITGVLQVALNLIDSHMDPAAAVGAPRVHQQAAPDVVVIEETMPASTRAALEKMGYRLRVVNRLGAVGAISISPAGLRGANDPRKGGAALGY